MIQTAIATPSLPSLTLPASASAPASEGGVAVDFADSLAAMLGAVPSAPEPIAAALSQAPVPGRQAGAATGKRLPDMSATEAVASPLADPLDVRIEIPSIVIETGASEVAPQAIPTWTVSQAARDRPAAPARPTTSAALATSALTPVPAITDATIAGPVPTPVIVAMPASVPAPDPSLLPVPTTRSGDAAVAPLVRRGEPARPIQATRDFAVAAKSPGIDRYAAGVSSAIPAPAPGRYGRSIDRPVPIATAEIATAPDGPSVPAAQLFVPTPSTAVLDSDTQVAPRAEAVVAQRAIASTSHDRQELRDNGVALPLRQDTPVPAPARKVASIDKATNDHRPVDAPPSGDVVAWSVGALPEVTPPVPRLDPAISDRANISPPSQAAIRPTSALDRGMPVAAHSLSQMPAVTSRPAPVAPTAMPETGVAATILTAARDVADPDGPIVPDPASAVGPAGVAIVDRVRPRDASGRPTTVAISRAAGSPTMQVAAAIMATIPAATTASDGKATAPTVIQLANTASPAPGPVSVPGMASASDALDSRALGDLPPIAAPAFASTEPNRWTPPTAVAATIPLSATVSPSPYGSVAAPSVAPASSALASASPFALPPVASPVSAGAEPSRWTPPAATAPVALAPSQRPLLPQAGTVASAAQVFGAAMRAVVAPDERVREPIDGMTSVVGLAAPQAVGHVAAVTQAPLDMRQERWPEAMIARIEILRDAADANDTRIRLVPDALGAIDVSMKRDGDTVRVHFTAEQAATRALLQDAQPRLADLAEARGLKLAQSGTGTGTDSQAGQQRQPATPQLHIPTAPPRAAVTTADTETDSRLA